MKDIIKRKEIDIFFRSQYFFYIISLSLFFVSYLFFFSFIEILRVEINRRHLIDLIISKNELNIILIFF